MRKPINADEYADPDTYVLTKEKPNLLHSYLKRIAKAGK